MSDPPHIIEYARAAIAGEIQIRREGDLISVIIPPPPFWRMIFLAMIRASLYAALIAFLLLLYFSSNGMPGESWTIAIPCVAIPITLIAMLIHLTRTASAGGQATILRASAQCLQIVPRGMMYRNCTWSASELTDISAREGGFLAVLARTIKLQVVLKGDRVETFDIPWNGNGALANLEDNLRDILALSTGSPAAHHSATSASVDSSAADTIN